jgi:hypothetical protein
MERVMKVGEKRSAAMGQLTTHETLLPMPPSTPLWMQLMMRIGMQRLRSRVIGLRIWEPNNQ